MEKERTRRGWTLTEMAHALKVPDSTYKNIIYGKTQFIDIEFACRMYDLTHRWAWEMCGYPSSDFAALDNYSKLPARDQKLMSDILQLVIERKKE